MERDCNICKYLYSRTKCENCISSDKIIHSKFKSAKTETKFTRAETDRTPCVDCDWQGCKTCVSQTIRGYIVGRPSNYHKKEKNMEYNNCDIPMPQGFGKQEGWICPVCGRGVAPHMNWCPCQENAGVINVTTTTEPVDLSKYYTLINDGTVPEAKFESSDLLEG